MWQDFHPNPRNTEHAPPLRPPNPPTHLLLRPNRLEIALHVVAVAERDIFLLDDFLGGGGVAGVKFLGGEPARGQLAVGHLGFSLGRPLARLAGNLEHLLVGIGKPAGIATGIAAGRGTRLETALALAEGFRTHHVAQLLVVALAEAGFAEAKLVA